MCHGLLDGALGDVRELGAHWPTEDQRVCEVIRHHLKGAVGSSVISERQRIIMSALCIEVTGSV